MDDNQKLVSDILDLFLPLSKSVGLTATAVVAYFHLYRIGGSGGTGYVSYADMSIDLGREEKCCRACLKLLRRHGLVEGAITDGKGGASFKLVLPKGNDPPTKHDYSELVVNQHPANSRLAPKCSAARESTGL